MNQIYNVAFGDRTTLNQLYQLIAKNLATHYRLPDTKVCYRDYRAGDVRHSQADISKAKSLLGYEPTFNVDAGLAATMPWYLDGLRTK